MTFAQLFEWQRELQRRAGLDGAESEVLCPLCWKLYGPDNLTEEHIVPTCIGGENDLVLTCNTCNHNLGSDLDAHAGRYQSAIDAATGHGTIKSVLRLDRLRIAANLQVEDGAKHFSVVGKATHPAHQQHFRERLASGSVDEIKVEFDFECRTRRFQASVLKSA